MNLTKSVLGIEFGSTRIKAVLLDESREIIASGSFTWENKLIDGIWTYSLDEVHNGMRECFADLKSNFEEKYNCALTEVGAIGISGMMHGFLAFDKEMKLLAPFRTWRNTITAQAAEELSKAFNFNIPQRWSIAHLYKDILEEKEYVNDICFLTTLSGYVHYLLTGNKVLGICEASGMFPIDSNTNNYNQEFTQIFEALAIKNKCSLKLEDILPKALTAGEKAGVLTEQGAMLLDPTGTLKAGIPFAPPEGDGGTGMVATNSVRLKSGNVSAGTSVFAMVVVDRLPKPYREIDMITTPDGLPVAMIHCNNCTSDINSWVKLFSEFAECIGAEINIGDIYNLLFKKALEGEYDCGGLISYNYLSGEGITDVDSGVPIFLRRPDSLVTLANFMRTHIYSSLATLKLGLDLLKKENIEIDKLFAHGGLFKTPEVGQRILSSAVGSPVTVSDSAGEGGPYGMALLTAYMLDKTDETLAEYLDNKIFSKTETCEIMASKEETEGFNRFMESYKQAFKVEKTATEINLR